MIPPALLMALAAGRQAAKYAGPRAASAPVNGATTPMSSGELLFDPGVVLPQAASPRVRAAETSPSQRPTR
jgi:hypothetical protein